MLAGLTLQQVSAIADYYVRECLIKAKFYDNPRERWEVTRKNADNRVALSTVRQFFVPCMLCMLCGHHRACNARMHACHTDNHRCVL